MTVAAALACVFLVASPAFAMTDAKVTLNEKTGGKSARFTFMAVTDEDAPTDSCELILPSGFDLSGMRVVVDTIEGVDAVPVKTAVRVRGTTIDLDFSEPIPAGEQLRVVMYDVITRNEGGTFALGVRYVVGGRTREIPGGLEFDYKTPPRWERATRWLDVQPFVERWRSFKFLDIFFRPQLAIEGLFLGFLGWLVSLSLVAIAFPLAIFWGLVLAFMRMSKIGLPRWVAAVYINVIRGTPLFLQIYIAFVGLRIVGFRMNDFTTGVVVLMLNSSAYLAEIFRAGIQSIHRGQFEAASSLGMTYTKTMRFVIIPQTVRRVLPTMTSEFILLFKDTALLFPVGVFELMMYSNQIVARSGNLTPFMVAAGYYLVVTIPLIHLVGKLEEKLAVSERGDSSIKPKRRGGLFWRPVTAGPISELEVSAAEHESR